MTMPSVSSWQNFELVRVQFKLYNKIIFIWNSYRIFAIPALFDNVFKMYCSSLTNGWIAIIRASHNLQNLQRMSLCLALFRQGSFGYRSEKEEMCERDRLSVFQGAVIRKLFCCAISSRGDLPFWRVDASGERVWENTVSSWSWFMVCPIQRGGVVRSFEGCHSVWCALWQAEFFWVFLVFCGLGGGAGTNPWYTSTHLVYDYVPSVHFVETVLLTDLFFKTVRESFEKTPSQHDPKTPEHPFGPLDWGKEVGILFSRQQKREKRERQRHPNHTFFDSQLVICLSLYK